ncbi:MAG: hypothetical protein KC492_01170, partial [Myxococcales bacterium]|nr:hypothetical protein [Myxococcales bacterium]
MRDRVFAHRVKRCVEVTRGTPQKHKPNVPRRDAPARRDGEWPGPQAAQPEKHLQRADIRNAQEKRDNEGQL